MSKLLLREDRLSDDQREYLQKVRRLFYPIDSVAADEAADAVGYAMLPILMANPSAHMPEDDAYTIIDWIDSVNADPDVSEDDDDEEATEWDEMSDYDLDGDEEDEEEEDWG